MRIYNPTYKDKASGDTKQVKKFWIETTDHLGKIRRFAGFTDRKQTAKLGEKIEKLIVRRLNNEPPDRSLSEWIESIPAQLRNQLVKIGILTQDRATIGKALLENINDYKKSLEARNRSRLYINETISAIKRIADDCGFNYWTDISAVKVESYLKSLRENTEEETGISFRRSNAYLTALKMFANWMIEQGRAGESPIRHLKGLNIKLDLRHNRRALTVNEFRRLRETTTAQPERFGMAGPERALLYRFAAETGLRANELRTLKVSSIDFDNCSVIVEAAYSKHRREDKLSIRPDTALELKQHLAGKIPTAQAFNMPEKTAKMLKADLKAAGIAYVDESGRYADFHCLRHTCGTLLAAAGVHPKTAQSIMRHSTIELTMGIYTHTLIGQEAQAVQSLPDLSLPSSKQITAKAG
jgi:integrase